MPGAAKTRIVCILPRLGKNVGGGKIKAMFRRMALLADREDTDVTLLNIQHTCRQKITFAELVAKGILDKRVSHQSIYEMCRPGQMTQTHIGVKIPTWDNRKTKSEQNTTTYFQGKTPVMQDAVEATPAGDLMLRRVMTDPNRDIRLKYLDGDLVESRVRIGDGVIKKTAYVDGTPRAKTTRDNKLFVRVEDFGLGMTFRNEAMHHRALVERFFPDDCVVFVDGITTAYLSPAIRAPKILFLHADHRRPNGTILSRSRARIDAFDGDAIVTATHVQKKRLEADTRHAAPIRVIPHYTTMTRRKVETRSHICTVSRLDLKGKPIHHCVEAFMRVMHLIPSCNYLIYGGGVGKARLQQLIDHHKCGDRVILMGQTSDPAAVFSSSLFSLAPTMTEGFGLALLESLTCGCPVISYDVDYGPRELIRPRHNGELVTPGDIDGIAQAILKVHTHHDHYATACPDSVQPYSFEVYKSRYYDLIDDLQGRAFGFDIMAPDLVLETEHALQTAPQRYKDQLLGLYIRLCEQRRDLGGMYKGFQQMLAQHPNDHRPLVRCVWLSRRLARPKECRAYLARLADRFPQEHARLVTRNPDLLELADAADSLG